MPWILAVHCVAAAASTDGRADCRHGRISHNGVEQGLLALLHRLEGNILRRLGLADDQSGILLGKEALGNDDIEIAGQCDGTEHYHQRAEAVPKHDLEARFIRVEQAVEATLGHAVEPSVLLTLRLE